MTTYRMPANRHVIPHPWNDNKLCAAGLDRNRDGESSEAEGAARPRQVCDFANQTYVGLLSVNRMCNLHAIAPAARGHLNRLVQRAADADADQIIRIFGQRMAELLSREHIDGELDVH